MLEVLRPGFTHASFPLFLLLTDGWIRTHERHAITACLLATGVAGRRDHTAFYRFFSRGTWDPDALGLLAFRALLDVLDPTVALAAALDDTLAAHKGPKVFGLGTHLDAVRSTRRTKVFTFGHVWVVLALVVPVPFACRHFALPLLFRLYRNETDCVRTGAPFRKKTELARELLEIYACWVAVYAPGRGSTLAVDCGYANQTVVADLPRAVVLVGAMRPDAALTTTAGATSPATLAADATTPWRTVEAWLYGRLRTVEYKTLVATWGRVCGTRPLRLVVVRCVNGTLPLRVFFCTEATVGVRALLEHYAATRWPIEVTFRDLKQWLGLAEPSVRVANAVRRMVPFIGLQYTLLVLWALRVGLTPATTVTPAWRWYRHKRTVSFGDILRTARKSLSEGDLHALAAARPPPRVNAADDRNLRPKRAA